MPYLFYLKYNDEQTYIIAMHYQRINSYKTENKKYIFLLKKNPLIVN